MAAATDHNNTPAEPVGLDQDGPWLNPAWFHPVLAALWLGVLALVPHWSELSPLWWLPVGIVVTLVARAAVRMWVAPGTHGENHYDHARNFTLAAGFTATAWLIYAGLTDKAGRALGLLALWTILTGSVYAVLRYRAPKAEEQIREARREHAAAVQRHADYLELKALWEGWCEQVGLSGVEVEEVVDTRAGYTLHLAAGPGEKGKVPRFSQFDATVEDLTLLASRHYRRQGINIAGDQVRPEGTDSAHVWMLHVDTRQPLKASIPHPGDIGPGTITEPVQIGLYQDAGPLTLNLLGVHTVLVGATGSGKSVCLNCVIAGLTRCPDLELWIGATSKLMPLVWPWLEPWLRGETARPVIERVAGENLNEVLLMLADLYKVGKLRNRRLGPLGSKHKPTPADPAIACIIDEVTAAATDTTEKVRTFDGREWTVSALLDAIAQMLRSAGGGLFVATQFGLMEALGDEGHKAIRNFTCRIVGRTERAHDGQSLLTGIKGVDTTQLRDFKLLVQPNNEVPRVIPAKTYNLDSDRPEEIRRLAIAHTRYRGNGLPQWLQEQLGGSYTERWRKFRQPTLVEVCEMAGIIYPIDDDGEPVAGTVAPAPREPLPVETTPGGEENPTGGGLPAQAATATLPDVIPNPSMHTTLAQYRTATENLAAVAQEAAEYPLSKPFTLVVRAFNHPQAPDQATARQLARASRLVDPETATEEEVTAAATRIVKVLTAYGAIPDSGEENPVVGKAATLAAWERAKADYYGSLPPRDPILEAVKDRQDSDWIGVGELGRLAGAITSGEDPRAAAAAFSADLRKRYQLDESAFKRASTGSVVSVAAIRAAANATQAA